MTSITTIIIPAICLIAGQLFQYFLTRRQQHEQEIQKLKIEAYSNFIKATTSLAFSQRRSKSSEIELQLEEVTKAKAQIVIYAPSKVISKMVNFWNGDPSLSSEQGKKAFVAMLYAMRADTFQHDHLVSEDDLKLLLLGKE